MKDPKHIHISDYNYDLPDSRIAKYPLAERDASKLLIYNHGKVEENTFTSLPLASNKVKPSQPSLPSIQT